MERKIDEIAATLEKWGTADNNRKYLLWADDGEFAYAVTFIAKRIDKLMQSEEVYQKLIKDNDLSENERVKMFIAYYKKAIAKNEALIKKNIEEES